MSIFDLQKNDPTILGALHRPRGDSLHFPFLKHRAIFLPQNGGPHKIVYHIPFCGVKVVLFPIHGCSVPNFELQVHGWVLDHHLPANGKTPGDVGGNVLYFLHVEASQVTGLLEVQHTQEILEIKNIQWEFQVMLIIKVKWFLHFENVVCSKNKLVCPSYLCGSEFFSLYITF